MSTISTTLYNEAKIEEGAKALLPLELVEDICAHLLAKKKRDLASIGHDYRHLPKVQYHEPGDWGRGSAMTAITKEQFQRLLAPWKQALGKLMLRYPRSDGESIADYYTRLTGAGSADNWWNHLDRMGLWLAHIARIEDEERASAQREEEERQARAERQRAERKAMEKQATVDEREVKRLRAIVEEAREVEELMAILERGRAARLALLDIYDNARQACVALGKPVPDDWPQREVIRISNPIAMNGEGRRSANGVRHG
jgi:hypothetical protein